MSGMRQWNLWFLPCNLYNDLSGMVRSHLIGGWFPRNVPLGMRCTVLWVLNFQPQNDPLVLDLTRCRMSGTWKTRNDPSEMMPVMQENP